MARAAEASRSSSVVPTNSDGGISDDAVDNAGAVVAGEGLKTGTKRGGRTQLVASSRDYTRGTSLPRSADSAAVTHAAAASSAQPRRQQRGRGDLGAAAAGSDPGQGTHRRGHRVKRRGPRPAWSLSMGRVDTLNTVQCDLGDGRKRIRRTNAAVTRKGVRQSTTDAPIVARRGSARHHRRRSRGRLLVAAANVQRVAEETGVARAGPRARAAPAKTRWVMDSRATLAH